MKQVLEVIGKGAAQSWQMDNRGATMIDGKFDFGFAVDWMRKDLGLVLDEAQRNGARLPVTALVDQFYADVQADGRRALGHVEPDQAAAGPERAASRPAPGSHAASARLVARGTDSRSAGRDRLALLRRRACGAAGCDVGAARPR